MKAGRKTNRCRRGRRKMNEGDGSGDRKDGDE